MLFDSLSFVIFLPVTLVLFFISPQKFKWLLLLIASSIFYMAFIPSYIFVLVFLICVDFVVGILLEITKGEKRKYILVFSIVSNIGILFIYKYFNFFNQNIYSIAKLLHWNYSPFLLQLALPIGLSFHTFQSLSYVIEVYKKRQKAERHIGIYALYVMFFPQLVAGPIERPQHLLPQFYKTHKVEEGNIKEGLQRILLGLFKKAVIADRLAILVNIIYADPYQYIGLPLVMATVAFAIQIYCDFSGYTDIAIGSARLMGFNLVENFNYPYLSQSIRDFWRRWNMSLYLWFRDYIYIPLGGNKVTVWRNFFNIMIVFLLTGFWHGASWNFIVWGAINGIYIIINIFVLRYLFISEKIKKTFYNLNFLLSGVRITVTFSLVCIAWVFFRANTLNDAVYIISNSTKGIGSLIRSIMVGNFHDASVYLFSQGGGVGLDIMQFSIVIFSVGFLCALEYLNRNNKFYKLPVFLRWGIELLIIFMIVNFQAKNKSPFIYFQF